MKKASALFLTVAMLLSMFLFLNFTVIDAAAYELCSDGHNDLYIEWDEFWYDFFEYGDSYVYWECDECCEYGSAYVTVTQSGYTYTGKVTINSKTYTNSYYYEEEDYCEYGHDDLYIEWDEFWDSYFDGGSSCVEWCCDMCGEDGNAEVNVSATTTKAATCTAVGSKKYTAKITLNNEEYTDIYTKTIAKKSHTYKTTTTKATLSKNGSIVKKCSNCSAKSTTTVYRPKTFTLSKTTYTYLGKAIKPTVTVKDSNGKKISSSYYTLSYKNNIKVGTATVTVKFKGNYSGTKNLTFKIKKCKYDNGSYTVSTKSGVVLRKSHGKNYTYLTKVPKEKTVKITWIYDTKSSNPEVRYWGKTKYNGKTGWVPMYYLSCETYSSSHDIKSVSTLYSKLKKYKGYWNNPDKKTAIQISANGKSIIPIYWYSEPGRTIYFSSATGASNGTIVCDVYNKGQSGYPGEGYLPAVYSDMKIDLSEAENGRICTYINGHWYEFYFAGHTMDEAIPPHNY